MYSIPALGKCFFYKFKDVFPSFISIALLKEELNYIIFDGSLHGVVAKVLDCNIIVSEFEL